jgi:hypothetical protein
MHPKPGDESWLHSDDFNPSMHKIGDLVGSRADKDTSGEEKTSPAKNLTPVVLVLWPYTVSFL